MQGFYIERKELVTERTSSLILGGSGLWPYPQETSKSDPRLGSWRSLAVSVPPIWPQVGSDFITVSEQDKDHPTQPHSSPTGPVPVQEQKAKFWVSSTVYAQERGPGDTMRLS